MLTDLRLALRNLRRSPVLAAAAVITLALASGATTAIFSVVRAVLLEALPYRDPSSLMFLRAELRRETPQPYPLSVLDVASLAADSTAFSGIVAITLLLLARGDASGGTGPSPPPTRRKAAMKCPAAGPRRPGSASGTTMRTPLGRR